MEQPVRRYSENVASTSSRSPSRSPGPSSSERSSNMMPQPRAGPDLHGRARKKAELNRLNQEIRLLQEELQRLDNLPPASEVCRLLVHSIESQIDPFLANSGVLQPVDPHWDRWFKGPPIPRSTCCCIPATRL
ncbi:unnamed protein product [Calypogeia fissa]